jgi:hypothetical protein
MILAGLGGVFDRRSSKSSNIEACLNSCLTVLGVLGVNWLELVLGRLLGGDGVRREILSFESTLSASIGTRPLAAKLF